MKTRVRLSKTHYLASEGPYLICRKTTDPDKSGALLLKFQADRAQMLLGHSAKSSHPPQTISMTHPLTHSWWWGKPTEDTHSRQHRERCSGISHSWADRHTSSHAGQSQKEIFNFKQAKEHWIWVVLGVTTPPLGLTAYGLQFPLATLPTSLLKWVRFTQHNLCNPGFNYVSNDARS